MSADRPTGLAWRTAWKIAWRDLHSSWGKFAFVVVAVALGVGSLTGMRSFSAAFGHTLLAQARTIMAADLSARFFHQPSDSELSQLHNLAATGVQWTQVTETVSMASTAEDPDPLLVSLKVVDPSQYPFYGTVKLASGGSFRSVLTERTAIVSEEFLLRMHSHVGDTLKLGDSRFLIADVVRSEPDRISSSFSIGPRVMITQTALPATGLVRTGSRASERLLFKLPEQGGNIDTLRKRVEAILPEAQITDFREANPALVNGLKRSTAMLTLVSLVTLVLSAIGVAMAMHAHLQQRLETIAIMKALGARSSQIMRIYLLQTLFIGLLGAVLGIVAGSAVARAFPVLLEHIISLPVQAGLAISPVLVGLLTGVLTTLLFTLPPLLEIRGFRPLQILRRNVEDAGAGSQRPGRIGRILPKDRIQLVAIAVILIGLAIIASTLTQSPMIGEWFAGGLFAVLVFLLFASSGALFLIRRSLERYRSRLSPSLRQGLANLYRPGNQSGAVLTALGVGVMLIMTVYYVQHAIVRDLHDTGSSKIPNVFLVDISDAELPGVVDLVRHQPAVHGAVETIPVISTRIVSIDGVPSEKLRLKHYPKRLLQSTSVSWADALPAGEKITQGRWWKQGSNAPELAVSQHTAELLHIKPGSHVEFLAGRRQFVTTVVAFYRSDGQHVYSRSRFIVPRQVVAGLPAVWYGAFHAEPARVGEVERALFAKYPTVTVINVADVLEIIRKVVDQIALIIRFLAGFAMLAGGIILASSVAATRFQRVREIAILKSLGALRRQIISMLSIEFLMLGGIAGIAGVAFSLALSAILLHKLDVHFYPGWAVSVAAVALTAALASVTGWLACYRMLQQKPLEVLRDE